MIYSFLGDAIMTELELSKYYLHSICDNRPNMALSRLYGIIKSGYIKTPLSLGHKFVLGFHCFNDICLTKPYEEAPKNMNCLCGFDLLMPSCLTIVLNNDIVTYKPELVAFGDITLGMALSGYYTDIYDEYRTTKDIPINKIVGISIPLSTPRIRFKYISSLSRIMKQFTLHIPIYEYSVTEHTKVKLKELKLEKS